MANLEQLKQQLRQIEEPDPAAVRRQVVKILVAGFGAKFGLFLKIVFRDGVGYWAAMTVSGDEEAAHWIKTVEGIPHFPDQLWNPWEPCTEEKDTFISLEHGPITREQLAPTHAYRRLYQPLGIHDHARALIYDGARFVGWIGLLREAGQPFLHAELDALNELSTEIAAALVAAENLDGVWQNQQLQFVLDPDTMGIEFASRNAVKWLNPRRREIVEGYVRSFKRDAAPSFALADEFELRAVELVGDVGTRIHLNVAACTAPSLGVDALLTPRQREVAELLVAGVTNREIARFLDISSETVKQHVKDLYKRLQIANRVELASLLAQSSNPRFDFR